MRFMKAYVYTVEREGKYQGENSVFGIFTSMKKAQKLFDELNDRAEPPDGCLLLNRIPLNTELQVNSDNGLPEAERLFKGTMGYRVRIKQK